jgi:3-keto-5-aminohexanoate cleavage enzyme
MSLSDRLIINAALTGMVPSKADNPHVPLTPDEIAADARRCVNAGASILHLHARDADGLPTYRPDIYQHILQAVRAACPNAILCVSTSGRIHRHLDQRSAVLDLIDPKPEMASLTLGSMNFARHESVNSPDMIRQLALRMKERSIVPELELFELGMAEYSHYLIKHQILEPPFYANILLGNLGTLGATRQNLALMIQALPKGTTWAAAGVGRFQYDVNSMAISLGGHVRTGLEDNLYFDPIARTPATNAGLIERLVTLARSAGRSVASPAEARAIIGLPEPAHPSRGATPHLTSSAVSGFPSSPAE